MKKKVWNIVIVISVAILCIVSYKCNVYETKFYSVFFQSVDIHTPLELEKVTYNSQLSMEVDGTYTFVKDEELTMWNDFVTWLNDTEFRKVRSTRGTSYTGEGIFFKFKGVEEELWIIVGEKGKSIGLGDYVWKPLGDIVLPVDEEYLLEKKAEQKKEE